MELEKSWQESSRVAGTANLQPTNTSSPKVSKGPAPSWQVPVTLAPKRVSGDVGCKIACLIVYQSK